MWKIKNFPGGREFLLRCKFGLPSVAAEEEGHGRLPPIKVKFEVGGPEAGLTEKSSFHADIQHGFVRGMGGQWSLLGGQ